MEKQAPGSPFTDGEIKTVSLKEMVSLPRDGAVFLLNDSGSGKSEYLKRLAWSWAMGEHQELSGQYDAVVYVSLLNDFDSASKGKSGKDQLGALLKKRWNVNLDSLYERKILWLFDEWEEALKNFGSDEALFRELTTNPSEGLHVGCAVIAMRPSSFCEDEFQCRAQLMIGDLSDEGLKNMAALLGLAEVPEKPVELKSLCRIPMFLELFCEASDKKAGSVAELLYESLKSRLKNDFDGAVRVAGLGAANDHHLIDLGLQFLTADKQVIWTHDLIRSFLCAAYVLTVEPKNDPLSEIEWQIVIGLLEISSFKTNQACVVEIHKRLAVLPNAFLDKVRARALYKTKDPKFVGSVDATLRNLPRQADLCWNGQSLGQSWCE